MHQSKSKIALDMGRIYRTGICVSANDGRSRKLLYDKFIQKNQFIRETVLLINWSCSWNAAFFLDTVYILWTLTQFRTVSAD